MADLAPVDGVIHMACDFASDMAAIDRHLLDVLLPHLGSQPKRARFLYTGGGWLFGPTGDAVATEEWPFKPLPAFAWMVPHLQRILGSADVEGIVIHPAMVHGGAGGVLRRFARDAAEGRPVRVVGSENVRWPLVHCDDLAALYALALEKARRRARAGSARPSRAASSDASPEPSRRTSRSCPPTPSPPSWASGRAAMAATSN